MFRILLASETSLRALINKLLFMKKLFLLIFVFAGLNASCQDISKKLQHNFIWSGYTDAKGAFTVFRKTFETEKPETAVLNIFADVRYILWINGKEVLRGPCRFDPKGAQYDFTDVASYLKSGKNIITVLVMAHGSNGKMMDHEPGLTLLLKTKLRNKTTEINTDETWVWNNQTRYLPTRQSWGFICDQIDARLDDGDWTLADYNDTQWQKAKRIDGNKWGKLSPRQIPLLGEWDIPLKILNGQKFPYNIEVDKPVIIELNRMIQGYASFDFETSESNNIEFEVGYTSDSTNITNKYGTTNLYIAKKGLQKYITTDSYGFRYIKITALNQPVKLINVKATDRRYPYIDAGRFSCNDKFLNELWSRAANTIRMNAEDGFMDCALREKTEWMGDAAVVEYPVSRVVLGYASDGKIIHSDAGLMKNMIRHIALSQTDSGTLKAHHPSDRWDIHGYIEDYSCLWVQSLRKVYDNTGDIAFVKEVWGPLKRQMQWFLNHRSSNNLLKAREFVIFDNPLAYVECEGATLNAFFYKALVDASYLAKEIGDKESLNIYSVAADELYTAYNNYLWIEEKQTYAAGLSGGRKIVPTAHTALLALYMGIVPEDRKEKVEAFMLANYNNTEKSIKAVDKQVGMKKYKLLDSAFDINTRTGGVNMPYTAFWLLEDLYNAGRDSLALNYIRTKWAITMKNEQTKTLTEGFGGGDLCHNFGSVPAYYLSTKVLGVTTLLPLKDNQIQIKPQLGDLTNAKGSVVTEHGVIDVSWEKRDENLLFSINIPKGIKAKVYLPGKKIHGLLNLNRKEIMFVRKGNEIVFELQSGKYTGSLK